MRARNWSGHHEQWHVESRLDFWTALAAQGNPAAQEIVDYARQNGWSRAPQQEGAVGNGLEFLGMHRAMLELLAEAFPQHRHLLAGWTTPPQDPNAPDDIVPNGAPFELAKAEAVEIIEHQPATFNGEDEFGAFVETNLRPTASNPLARSPDPRTGIHNWLHNRWTDVESEVNLGDPTKNIFNARFWRLHGWIDTQWSRFRIATGLSDADAAYKALIDRHKDLMRHVHPHAHRPQTFSLERTGRRLAALQRFFADIPR
ncbi:MAG: hypothetical protein F9K29_14715 [Hyphomicrobiaceae bacterium]|nr:MAG: hypothetical protein F9K29_14715 [Hyphomicrobiaceae bacterium]